MDTPRSRAHSRFSRIDCHLDIREKDRLVTGLGAYLFVCCPSDSPLDEMATPVQASRFIAFYCDHCSSNYDRASFVTPPVRYAGGHVRLSKNTRGRGQLSPPSLRDAGRHGTKPPAVYSAYGTVSSICITRSRLRSCGSLALRISSSRASLL